MNRIDKIKERLFNYEFVTKKEWWGSGTTILTDEQVKSEPLIIRKALATGYVLRNLPVEIKADELIVGVANMAMVGFGHVFPDYALPEEKEAAAKIALNEMSVWGHIPINYEKLLGLGLSGLRKQVTEKLAEELARENPDTKKMNLYHAMILTLNALRDFAQRYSEAALAKALEEQDAVRRQELLKISEICSRVPEQPAETLWEALQSFWLTFAALHSCLEHIPTGRSDQYLYPYFQKDIDSGRLSVEQAKDLLGSWMAKFGERVQLKAEHWEDHFTYGDFSQGGDPVDASVNITLDNSESYNYGISANHWLINMILGGQTRDGKDATNELTYLLLEVWGYLEAVVPVMSVRFHQNSPHRLYEACARILRKGAGEPAIYNDEPIIEGFVKMGIPVEDARDYANDGCWETLIPGKTDFSYSHAEVLLLLEYVFNRGISLLRGTKEGLDTGDPTEFADFEEFYQAFKTQLDARLNHLIDNKLKYYAELYKIAPDPLISSMLDGPIEKGLDLSEGGASYIIHSPIITGLANCVDSLAAVKKLVYEEKAVTMAELIEALKANFEGREPLRQ
ncbi:MAG: pyruvate formate lyase family protein, partial [Firmicutes bacterium]|nr:pyruvate formate lyase family protein [Bacillota bacterium]